MFWSKKYFESTDEAKAFLIAKLVQEASLLGQPFSANEHKFLGYSPTEPSTTWGLDLDDLPPDTVEEQYQDGYLSRMAEIMRSAERREKETNPDKDEVAKFRSALKQLSEEDYVIVDIAQKAFG